ncbi:MAG: hypothetical protein A3H71_01300 [Candidatus Sungbacteria bacterium RIFCSPLOWO2_02_FULL_48_13b]|uniref:LamG-like jellyroll fold domain-containing protein n=1 Tax=Candidatus Sungbacteria bacterium RIFCSPLOWO2_02_FULL_48_13b TaxID=1802283 RepID=A0A1G2LL18_9BACT|nr:MAG: hypothetical protein A3H71_01300 [Candidatus Sungbacteria bacterium RIFCSPLOWO2_02_FULL_48_13b]
MKMFNLKFKIGNLKFAFASIIFLFYAANADAGSIIQAPTYLGLSSGLVGSWTFNAPDMSGVTAFDRSGNNNNGTLANGPARAIGRIGQALNFDGSDDYVNAGSATVLDNISIVTYAAWIYPISYGENGRGNIINKTQLGNGPIFYVCQTTTNCGGSISNSFVYYQTFANGQTTWAAPSNSIPLNRWSHVAVTYTVNVANNPQLYLDGVPVVTTKTLSSTGANTDDSGNSLTIGNRANVDLTFNGLIDEVRVYNRALTPAEIRQLYKAGSSFHPNVTNKSTIRDGLVGHWSFDGADMGTTSARDASGNANTGWLINGTQKAIGRIGQALNFDGSNDYVNAGSAAALDNLSQISVSAWVFPRTFGGNGNNDGVIISKSNTSINVGGWGIQLTGSTGSPCTVVNFKFAVDYDVQDLRRDTNFGSITCGVWQHVVATWDGSANTSGIRLYINGVETSYGSEWSGVTSRVSDAAYPMRIGNSGLGNDTWGGIIDEVRVYNRALSPDEVKRLYNMGR